MSQQISGLGSLTDTLRRTSHRIKATRSYPNPFAALCLSGKPDGHGRRAKFLCENRPDRMHILPLVDVSRKRIEPKRFIGLQILAFGNAVRSLVDLIVQVKGRKAVSEEEASG